MKIPAPREAEGSPRFSRTTGEERSPRLSIHQRWVVARELISAEHPPFTDGVTEVLSATRVTLLPASTRLLSPGAMDCQGPAEAGGGGCPQGCPGRGTLWADSPAVS